LMDCSNYPTKWYWLLFLRNCENGKAQLRLISYRIRTRWCKCTSLSCSKLMPVKLSIFQGREKIIYEGYIKPNLLILPLCGVIFSIHFYLASFLTSAYYWRQTVSKVSVNYFKYHKKNKGLINLLWKIN
jgi:hypothetical protein